MKNLVRRRQAFAVLIALSVAIACGCAPKTESQYKMLSFFFDGVPYPEEKKPETAAEIKKEEIVMGAVYIEHGPYAAKRCDGCHVKGTNRLVLPKSDLCFQCHTLDLRKKNIHGPLASGGCTVCHLPHGSRYPFLLVAEPQEFCLYCHAKEDLARNEVHKGIEAQCTMCHDAHGSDSRYLLK